MGFFISRKIYTNRWIRVDDVWREMKSPSYNMRSTGSIRIS